MRILRLSWWLALACVEFWQRVIMMHGGSFDPCAAQHIILQTADTEFQQSISFMIAITIN